MSETMSLVRSRASAMLGMVMLGLLPSCVGNTEPGEANESVSTELRRRFVLQDYDGDGKTDLAVVRGAGWYVHPSGGGPDLIGGAYDFGALCPGDYNGDLKADMAWTHGDPNGHRRWFGTAPGGLVWGYSGDIPVAGDYDGDGKIDEAVFRPSDVTWYILPSGPGSIAPVAFGRTSDRLVPSDYDGDGKTDIAVFRPSEGKWYVRRSSGGPDTVTAFGVSSDRLVPDDYDGDNKTDIAVFRPSEGKWYIKRSSGGADIVVHFGVSSDRLVPGDYDGDAKADVAVFRPSNGTWYVRRSSGGADMVTAFGVGSDLIPYAK